MDHKLADYGRLFTVCSCKPDNPRTFVFDPAYAYQEAVSLVQAEKTIAFNLPDVSNFVANGRDYRDGRLKPLLSIRCPPDGDEHAPKHLSRRATRWSGY